MKIAIIGGGVAGLTAAVNLTEKNHDVTLFEASKKCGGRIASIKFAGDQIDIGQHLLLGCYNNTLEHINKIGSRDLLDEIKSPDIPFVEKNGNINVLKISNQFPFPLNLAYAMFKFPPVKKWSSLRTIFLLAKTGVISVDQFVTVKDFLVQNKIPDDIVNIFWKPLCESIMNTALEESPAHVFFNALRMAFSDKNSFNFILPKTTLEDLIVNPSLSFIKRKNGKILTSSRIHKVELNDKKVELYTKEKSFKGFDKLIIATNPKSLEKIYPVKFNINENFITNPILNIHIKLKENPLKEKFYSIINGNIHWIFNHNTYLSLTISNAEKISKLSKDKIENIIINELKSCFEEIDGKNITDIKIISFPNSTWNRSVNSNYQLLNTGKIILAGDWTYSNLPSTIESATISGIIASNLCCK